jgi:aspartyl-tRNA(Asn)/glutamyl-tRNA(Gln) amidotransferase subunit C
MSIDSNDIRHLEKLAALQLADGERERMRGHLQRILAYMQQLADIDVGDVEPTWQVVEAAGERRDDTPQPSLDREAVLGNAPDARDGFYRVPRFLGEGPEAPA